MNYHIEKASPADAEAIAAFQFALVGETDHLEPDLGRMLRGVRHVFEDPSVGFYLAARDDSGAPIGCLLIQREWSDWRDAFIWWIHSVYVSPEHRKRGILRRMIVHAEELAKLEGAAGLRLYTEVNNITAKAAYQKVGLMPGYYDFLEKMF
ncbi:MAG: GNAT family N-acetyltransferase [Candidatus Latescibacterota bacterium]